MAEGGAKPERLEAKMDQLLKLFSSMDERMKGMESALGIVVKDIKELEEGFEKQEGRIEILEKEVKSQNQIINNLKRQQNMRLNNLEDRLRRRNLRFRGFKRGFDGERKLLQAIQEWLKTIGIDLHLEEEVERIYWGGVGPAQQQQRDVVLAFLSEKRADLLYKEIRRIPNLKYDGNEIRVLRDLSHETLKERVALRPIANLLFRNGVKFTWGFPAAILVYQRDKFYRVRTSKEGTALLSQLGIDFQDQTDLRGGVEARADNGGRTIFEERLQDEKEREERLKMLEAQLAALKSQPMETRQRAKKAVK